MPNGHDGTAADWAHSAANDAKSTADQAHSRITTLENLLIDRGILSPADVGRPQRKQDRKSVV